MGPELKARFGGDTTGYDAAVLRMRRRTAEWQADVQKSVLADKARNQTIISAQEKASQARRKTFDANFPAPNSSNRAALLQAEIEKTVIRENAERARNRKAIVDRVAASRTEYFAEIAERNRLERQSAARSGGGFFSRFSRLGAANSMFISAARDTATSLASGAPISQVMAQQLPQVLQGFSMIGISLKSLGLGAAAAGLALFTLKKGAEALRARQQEADSRVGLAVAQSSNRQRLRTLLDENSNRMRPGESADLKGQLWRAIAANSDNTTPQTEAELARVEELIRARLREVIIIKQQKENLQEIGDISTENMINTLEGFDLEKARSDQKYRETKAKIKDLAKGLTDPQDLNAVAGAYNNARLAYEKEQADIERRRNEPESPTSTGRGLSLPVDGLARIGGFSASTVLFNPMLNATNQMVNELRAINRNTSSRGGGLNSLFE